MGFSLKLFVVTSFLMIIIQDSSSQQNEAEASSATKKVGPAAQNPPQRKTLKSRATAPPSAPSDDEYDNASPPKLPSENSEDAPSPRPKPLKRLVKAQEQNKTEVVQKRHADPPPPPPPTPPPPPPPPPPAPKKRKNPKPHPNPSNSTTDAKPKPAHANNVSTKAKAKARPPPPKNGTTKAHPKRKAQAHPQPNNTASETHSKPKNASSQAHAKPKNASSKAHAKPKNASSQAHPKPSKNASSQAHPKPSKNASSQAHPKPKNASSQTHPKPKNASAKAHVKNKPKPKAGAPKPAAKPESPPDIHGRSIFESPKELDKDPACNKSSESEEAKQWIEELRAALDENLTPGSVLHTYTRDNEFLFRWLAVHDWNISLANQYLMATFKWRKQMKIDHLEEENWEDFATQFPIFIETHDRAGRPIVEWWLRDWDIASAVQNPGIGGDKLFRWLLKYLEAVTSKLFDSNYEWKHCITQAQMLVDVENLDEKKHGCPQCLKLFEKFASIYEHHYPELFHRIYFSYTEDNHPFMKVEKSLEAQLKHKKHTMSSFRFYKRQTISAHLNLSIAPDQRSTRFGGKKNML